MADDPAITVPIDAALAEAAAWRGLSPADYVRTVVAEAVGADAELVRLARESLGPEAAFDQAAMDAWFDARRSRQED